MTMRIGVIGAAILLVLLPGCKKAEVKNPGIASPRQGPAEGTAAQPEESRAPYYYGLIEEYRTILAEDPKNLAVTIALGNAYYDSGQWKEAVTVYEQALRLDPRNVDARTDMGTAYRNLGMPDRALAEYRTVLAYQPGHQNARYNMGIVYAYDKHDYASAVRVWEDLLRMSPHHPESDRMRGCIVAFKKALARDGK